MGQWRNTRTPVKVALLCLVVNAALNLILMFPMKLSGIALASAIASLVNVGTLFMILERRLAGLKGAFGAYFARLFAAGIVMGALIWGLWHGLSGIPELARLFVAALLGGAGYLAAAFVFGLEQARQLVRKLIRLPS